MQEFNKLLDRVNAAKAVMEDALKRITSNNNELDSALNGLQGRSAHHGTDTCPSAEMEMILRHVVLSHWKISRCVMSRPFFCADFEQQVDGSKTLADDATKRLPAINATIQKAAGNNALTQSVLTNVSADHSDALEAINALKGLLSSVKVGDARDT